MANKSVSWGGTLPKKLAAKVASELQADESILWVGQPGLKLEVPPVAKQRIALFFVLAIIATIVAILTDDWLRTTFWVVAGLLWGLVVAGLSLPFLWRLGVVQRNFYYLITNRRAVICYRRPSRGSRLELRSYTPTDLSRMTCIERADGSGDLRFEGDDQKPVSLREGFVMIEKVREVENLLRQTFQLK